MNSLTEKMLGLIADWNGAFPGAFNIREDSQCAGRQDSEHVRILSKKDKPGIDIHIDSGARGERVAIPACVTHSAVDDLVYNDFYVAKGADVTIVAGCGVHADGEEDARHNGIHRFFLEEGAHVLYLEKHIGLGDGNGRRIIDPQTHIELAAGASMEMITEQIRGVDSTRRKTDARLAADARLVIKEKIMTHGVQIAETDFTVDLDGEGAGVDLVSRSVAKGRSRQMFRSRINGNTRCTGHSECDAIIMENGVVGAMPELTANHIDASLIHEAAIGKIAGEQLIKLMSLGLTEREAEEKIIEGFLK
ncbi:MAG: ABC transporter permease [Desulfovibrionaceae bacterium]|nr:MAG: ABC transporter permease [Desulfovibrionaceae bacterium]